MKGDGMKAISEFRTVVNEKPESVPALLRLAEAHALNQETELAVDTLHKALKIDPKSKDALMTLSRVCVFKRLQRG